MRSVRVSKSLPFLLWGFQINDTNIHKLLNSTGLYSQDYHFKYISVGWWQTFYSHKLRSIRLSSYVCISSASAAEQKILAWSHEQRATNLNSLSVSDEFLYCVQDRQTSQRCKLMTFLLYLSYLAHLFGIFLNRFRNYTVMGYGLLNPENHIIFLLFLKHTIPRLPAPTGNVVSVYS